MVYSREFQEYNRGEESVKLEYRGRTRGGGGYLAGLGVLAQSGGDEGEGVGDTVTSKVVGQPSHRVQGRQSARHIPAPRITSS